MLQLLSPAFIVMEALADRCITHCCIAVMVATEFTIITAARPAYAGTKGCYILRLFFFFLFFI